MSDPVYLTRLTVRNFGGVEFFESKLGQIVFITGANGTGKTTLLESIRTVIGGGSDPACIRVFCSRCGVSWLPTGKDAVCGKCGSPESQQADFAKLEVALSNGDTFEKIIKPLEFKLEGKSREGGIIKAAATRLKELAPSISFDPIAFLKLDPRKRSEFLLANMALQFTAGEVCEACGQAGVVSEDVSLQKLNEIRQGRYDERTTINTRERDLQGSIQSMRRTLPDETDKTDWAAQRDALTSRYTEIQGEIEAAGLKITASAIAMKTNKRTEIDLRISELKAELASYIAEVDSATASALATATRDLEAERAVVAERVGEAKEKASAQMRAEGVRDAINEAKKSQQDFITRAMKLTAAIEKLDHLKAEKLRALPIDGFDLTYDTHKRPVITVHGVPLDNLNEQRQIVFAMQAVTQASGHLPLVLCEGSPFDDDHMALVAEAMRDCGMQLIAARLDNGGPLAIKDAA